MSPSLWRCWGSGCSPGLERAPVAPLPVCATGLGVPGAISGKGWVLFVLNLPIWKKKAAFSCQRDEVAGHSQGCVSSGQEQSWGHHVPAAMVKTAHHSCWLLGVLLYPHNCPQHPTALGVPTRGTCQVPPLWGWLPGLKGLVAHDHESPAGLGQGAGGAAPGADGTVSCPSSTGSSDPYCIVKVDDEAIIR